ncbi:MAG: glycosyl hydrolase [Acidobacteriota bacterium]|nr:glycosyl hydrolase [Acidobacteriota bacterium]
MKVFILLSTIFLFAAIAEAQWQKQTVNTKASLRGLSVVNEKIIWASGTGGTFLRTIDGGKNWKVGKVPDAEKLDFRDVEAFDANTAYLLSIGNGETSRIYKTVDGGTTWKLQFKNDNPNVFLDAFAFWDKTHGIAMSDPVGGKYLLLETTDGETWKFLDNTQMPNAKDGEAAFAASGTCLITQGKNNVFLVTGGNEARVFRSNNRGLSWTISQTPIVKGTAGSGIFSIAMIDEKTGVVVGGNYEKPNEITNNFAFTKDGGKTWESNKGLNGYRSSVAIISKSILIAVGSSGSDVSFDGGNRWKSFGKENLNSVQAKGTTVWAVGADGLVAKTTLSIKW